MTTLREVVALKLQFEYSFLGVASVMLHFQQPRIESCKSFLGGGFKYINVYIYIYFQPPKLGEDEPILTFAFFSKGWFNHQLGSCYLGTHFWHFI